MKHGRMLLACLMLASIALPATARQPQPSGVLTLTAPDGAAVTIERDAFGVPHIESTSEAGVFFGQGFAIAQDRLVQLERFRRAAQGRLSLFNVLGEDNTAADEEVLTLLYTRAERRAQFQRLAPRLRRMLEAYRDGINTYLDSMRAAPARHMPQEVSAAIQLGFPIEPWTTENSIAVTQFMMRRFGQNGGEELERLAELQANGPEWFDEHRPLNDPTAPTTVSDGHGGMTTARPYAGPAVRPAVVQQLASQRARARDRFDASGLPPKLGSFAVLLGDRKTNGPAVMQLGAPQMGEPRAREVSIVNEVELQSPMLHVGGMTIAGIPGVIIGRNDAHAWTLTSGASDNSDVYVYTTRDAALDAYWYEGAWRAFEVFTDTLYTPGGPRPFTHYRTVHGPVFGADLANRQAYALKMTFWDREIDMFEAFYRMWTAETLSGFEDGVRRIPMSLNIHYAGRDHNIAYWHAGRYQDRADGVDPRLPHQGDGSEEWGGFIPFDALPSAVNPPQGYLVNWNNKPAPWWDNGDNIPWAFANDGDAERQVDRVRLIEGLIQGKDRFSFAELGDLPRQMNRACQGTAAACLLTQGTYQHVIAFIEDGSRSENILPPGQSAFVGLDGRASPHRNDQWPLYTSWDFKDMGFDGSSPTANEDDGTPLPGAFALSPNHPNPFSRSTRIEVALPAAGPVRLAVYDLLGREVAVLLDAQKPAGRYQVAWEPGNAASGLYVYRLQAGNYVASGTMLLLR